MIGHQPQNPGDDMTRRFAYFNALTLNALIILAATGCNSILDTVVSVDADDVPPGEPRTGQIVVADSRNWGDDDYVVNSAAISGNDLTVEVSYSGGCRTHALTLVIAEAFAESDPVQLSAVLAHEADGDPCQAWLTEQYVFDLDLVRTRYRDAYGPGAGTVVLQIAGLTGDRLVYEFTS